MRLKPRPFRKITKGHPMSKGLVGCWLFNEGGGDIAYDLSGNANHSSAWNGNTTWAPGKYGPATLYDNNGDYITVPDSPSLSPTTGITVLALFYPTDVTFRGIVTKFDIATSTYGDYSLYMGNGDLVFRINSANSMNAGVITANQWHHVVGTYRSSDQEQAIYLDGAPKASGNSFQGALNASGDPLEIGVYNTGTACLNGLIDYVMIWDRALLAFEIQSLYYDPFQMFRSGPIEIWTAATSVGGAPPAGIAVLRRRIEAA